MRRFGQFKKLPLLVKKRIFEFLTKMDLFHYSLVSSKTLHFIESLRTKAQILKWSIHDTISEEDIDYIALSFKNCWNLIFYLNILTEDQWNQRILQGGRVYHLQGSISLISRVESGLSIYIYSTTLSEDLIRALSAYLQRIYQIERFSLQSWQAPVALFQPYLLEKRIFSNLEFYPDYDEDEEQITYTFSSETLRILLEDVKAEFFKLLVPIEEFKYTEPLNHEKMEIQEATWLTIHSLISSDNIKVLEATGTLISAGEVISFITKWLEGGFSELEWIYLWSRDQNFEEILEKFDFTKRDQNLQKYHGRNSCDKGYDIRRPGDGLLATVVVNKGQLRMMVWQKKFID